MSQMYVYKKGKIGLVMNAEKNKCIVKEEGIQFLVHKEKLAGGIFLFNNAGEKSLF